MPPEIAGKMAIPTLLLPPETADLPDRRLVNPRYPLGLLFDASGGRPYCEVVLEYPVGRGLAVALVFAPAAEIDHRTAVTFSSGAYRGGADNRDYRRVRTFPRVASPLCGRWRHRSTRAPTTSGYVLRPAHRFRGNAEPHVISAPAPTGLDKAWPLKRGDAMKETLAKEFPTPARPTAGSAPIPAVRVEAMRHDRSEFDG